MKIDTNLYYLLAMLGSVIFPFIFSFDKKVNFKQYFKTLFITIPIVALVFILGDILYTYLEVWGFDEHYHLNYKLLGLPLEEIIFFMVIPYCCIFIYKALKGYFQFPNPRKLNVFLLVFAVFFALLSLVFYSKLYTTLTCLGTSLLLFYLYKTKKVYTFQLLVSYLVSVIPFLLVNGFLTGMFMETPIVWYNDTENIGVRLITIPIEDLSYSFNMIAMNIVLFEFFLKKRNKQSLDLIF